MNNDFNINPDNTVLKQNLIQRENPQKISSIVPIISNSSPQPSYLDEQDRKERAKLGHQLIDQFNFSHCESIEDSLFAHIYGNAFADSPFLQGSYLTKTLSYMKYFLEKHFSFEGSEKLCQLFQEVLPLSQKIDQLNVITSLPHLQEEIHSLSKELSKKLTDLKPGQKMLSPVGYKGSPGHAMLCLWIAEQDGTLSLEVFNTGVGLAYHQPEGLKGHLKYYPVKRFEKISKNPPLFTDFFQIALEYELRKGDPPNNVEDIYTKLLPMLNGIEKPFTTSLEDFIAPQNMGHCAQRVLYVLVRRHFLLKGEGLQHYKEFKHTLRRISLIHYFSSKKKLNELSKDTTAILLERALIKFARSVKKLKPKEIIQDEALIEAIKEDLQLARKGVLKLGAQPVLKFSATQTFEGKNSYTNPLIHRPGTSQGIEFESLSLSRPSLEGVIDLKACNRYLEECLRKESKKSNLEALHFFEETLSKLPFKRPYLFEDIHLLATSAFKAVMNLRNGEIEPIQPVTVLYYQKALKLLELAAKRDPKNHLDRFRLLPLLDSRLLNGSPYFILGNSLHEKNLEELMEIEKNERHLTFLRFNQTIVIVDKNYQSEERDFYKKHYPNSDHIPDKELDPKIFADLASDLGDKNFLPKQVGLLKKHHIYLHFLIEAATSDLHTTNFKDVEIQVKVDQNNHQFNVFTKLIPSDQQKILPYKTTYRKAFRNLFISIEKEFHPILKSGFKSATENQVVLKEKIGSLTFEETRDLATLFLKAPNLPFNALAFFTKYLPRLGESLFQEIFEVAFFSPQKLDTYLKKQPQFAGEIATFVKKGIAFFEQIQKWDVCAFLSQIIDRVPFQHEDFPDRKNSLVKWFKQSNQTSQKVVIAHHLVHCFEKRPIETLEDYELFLTAYVYFQSKKNKENLDPLLKYEVEGKIHQYLQIGKKLSLSLTQDMSILTRVVKTTLEIDISPLNWVGEYPIYKAKNYELHLDSGALFIDGIPTTGLPQSILEEECFIKLFSNQVFAPQRVGPFCYQFKDREALVRVFHYQARFVYQRQFENRWMQLIPKEKFKDFIKCQELIHSDDLYYWVDMDCQKNRSFIIISSKLKILYEVEIDHSKIRISQRGDPREELVNIYENPDPFCKALQNFEKLEWISLWKASGTGKEIAQGTLNFSRYGLTFDVRDGIAWSKTIPDYFLASPKEWSGLGPEGRYLVLKNREGELKVILPRLQFDEKKEPDAQNPLLERFPTKPSQAETMVYNVDKKGHLLPNTFEQHLYLAYLYLCKGRSQETLRSAFQHVLKAQITRPYSKSEVEICKWILYPTSPTYNRDPKFNAMRIKLFCLSEQNKIWFPRKEIRNREEEELLLMHLVELYGYFLKTREHCPSILRPHEEELLIRFLEKEDLLTDHLLNLLALREGKSLKMKPEDITFLKKDPKALQLENWKMENLDPIYEDFSKVNRWLTPEEMWKEPIVRTTFFPACFKTFFQILKSGNPLEKERVVNRLLLIKIPSKDIVSRQLRDYLLFLNRFPEGFNSLPSLPDPLQDYELKNFFAQLQASYIDFKYSHVKAPIPKRNPYSERNLTLQYVKEGLDKREMLETKNLLLPQKVALRHPEMTLENLESFFDEYKIKNPLLSAKEFRFKIDPHQSPQINTHLQECNQELQNYFDSAKEVLTMPIVKDQQKMLKVLNQKISEKRNELKSKKEALLKLVNKSPLKPAEKAFGLVSIHSHEKQIIPFKTLLYLYLQGTPEDFQKLNPELNQQDLMVLMQKMSDYLEIANVQKKRIRAQTILRELISLKDKGLMSMTQKLSQDLENELKTLRSYHGKMAGDRIRACQIFEYLSNMQIRPKQIQMIENILDGKIEGKELEFVSQLIMGGGKSKVILPLLALLLADGKHLAVLLVPKAQIETQIQYMAEISGGLFKQSANCFHFDIKTPFTVQYLTDLHNHLLRIIHNREYLVLTPETLQALELRWVECRKKISEGKVDDQNLHIRMHKLGEILRLLRSKAKTVMDEADSILNTRNELHIATGSGKAIKTEYLKFIYSIYQNLISQPELNSLLGLSTNSQVANSKEHWAIIKQKLAETYEKEFCSKREDRDDYFKYVTGSKECKEMPKFIEKLDPLKKDLLAILKGEINTFLPLTLSKYGFQDYAFSADPNIPFAIPAHHSQPLEGSQFGNQYEALNYTLQMALQGDITERIVISAINRFKQQVFEAMRLGRVLEECPAFKTFNDLFPGRSLFSDDPSLIGELTAIVNKNPSTKLLFAHLCMTSEIKLHPSKISSDPLRLVSMLYKLYAVTGTPYNYHTYHPRLCHANLDKGTDGFTMALLLQKEMQLEGKEKAVVYQENLDLSNKTEEEAADCIVAEILKTTEVSGGQKLALIDSGAIFKGISMDAIAKAYLKALKPKGIKGVVFFRENKLMSLEIHLPEAIPFENSLLKPSERITLFDQPHAIGTDIKQSYNAKGIVSQNENSLLKDLLQAVWRLRQLDQEQKIIYLIPKSCQKIILATLEKDPHSEITVADILTYLIIKQALQLGDDRVRSWKLSIIEHIRNVVISSVLEWERQNGQVAQYLFNACDLEGLFSSEQEDTPFKLLGQIETTHLSETILERFRTQWLSRFKALERSGVKEVEKPLKDIHRKVEFGVKELPMPSSGHIPATLPEPHHDDLGTQVQIEENIALETQVNLKTEVKQEVGKNILPNTVWEWRGLPEIEIKELNASSLNNFHILHPYFCLMEYFKEDSELSCLLALLEGDLKGKVAFLFSNNFHTVAKGNGTDTLSSWYDQRQKPINQFYLNFADNKVHVMLMSADDVLPIAKSIQRNQSGWIFDLRLKTLMYGDPHSKQYQNFLNNKVLMGKLLLVLKVLNGEVSFKKVEIQYLKKCFHAISSEELNQAFNRILMHKDSRHQFQGSDLEGILLEHKKTHTNYHENTIQLFYNLNNTANLSTDWDHRPFILKLIQPKQENMQSLNQQMKRFRKTVG